MNLHPALLIPLFGASSPAPDVTDAPQAASRFRQENMLPLSDSKPADRENHMALSEEVSTPPDLADGDPSLSWGVRALCISLASAGSLLTTPPAMFAPWPILYIISFPLVIGSVAGGGGFVAAILWLFVLPIIATLVTIIVGVVGYAALVFGTLAASLTAARAMRARRSPVLTVVMFSVIPLAATAANAVTFVVATCLAGSAVALFMLTAFPFLRPSISLPPGDPHQYYYWSFNAAALAAAVAFLIWTPYPVVHAVSGAVATRYAESQLRSHTP